MRPFFIVPLLCLGPACSGIGAREVAERFREDYERAQLILPSQKDPVCGRAAGDPMAGTIELADRYLDQNRGQSSQDKYVRSLLACALLMRGEAPEARDVLAESQPSRDLHLSYENQVVVATRHAVSACRAVEARAALLACFNEEMPVEEFIERWGSFIAVELPSRRNPEYQRTLDYHVRDMYERCFAQLDGDPRAMEEEDQSRMHYRRLLGEQIYNDAASLLANLPEGHAAETRYLASQAVSLFVVYSFVMPDLMSMKLRDDQKQWKWEVANSIFREAKKAAAYFLTSDERDLVTALGVKGEPTTPAEARLHLYAKLLSAHSEVRGWIETR